MRLPLFFKNLQQPHWFFAGKNKKNKNTGKPKLCVYALLYDQSSLKYNLELLSRNSVSEMA